MFQSAPGDEAGRNLAQSCASTTDRPFQSAPGDEAGRNKSLGLVGHQRICFNPLPAMKPGGTHRLSTLLLHTFVSIRSRR